MSYVAPAHPAPLGLFALGTTTLLVGLLLTGARGVESLQICIGQVTIVGGLGMLISGFWNYQQGSNFGTVAFGMYGLFYMSFGMTLYPEAGAAAAYADPADYSNGVGLYLCTWLVLSVVLWPVTWRLNVGLAVLFTLVVFYFLFLTIGFMSLNTTMTKVGGYFGILVGTWAYVLGVQALYDLENALVKFPNPSLAGKPREPPSPETAVTTVHDEYKA